ncbi:MAG: DUF2812 domain-containing protein [Candidatus Krumholzibacteria bacterium]|jgi:hypothetical protein|nr:DUF2812 domain-containing protein [Candidatus Krumholzibacteria bacterium]
MATLTRFRWFWAWDDEKEEKWLTEMANNGWHLIKVQFPGRYTFGQGEPRNIFYRLDFFTDRKKREDYLQIFADAGWEHVAQYGSWQYFRKEGAPGEEPEIFTDNESKVKKYGRIIAILVPLTPIWIVMINRLSRRPEVFFQIVTIIGFLLMLLYIYTMLNMIRRVSRLKRK